MITLTQQDWIDAGYRKWDSVYIKPYSSYGLQKKVWTEDGEQIKYFITVYAYEYTAVAHKYENMPYWKYSAEVVLFQSETHRIDITQHGWNTIKELEECLENLYTVLNCIPDVDNN